MEKRDIVIYKTDTKNKNGIYLPHEVLLESISSMKSPVFGRLSPEEYNEDIDLRQASHVCHDFVVDGEKNEVRCDITVLSTVSGQVLENILDRVTLNAHSSCDLVDGAIVSHKLISIDAVMKDD